VLFLYRPRQTWMPFSRPFKRTEQSAYNRSLQAKFDSTRRVAPAAPTPAATPIPPPRDPEADLQKLTELHDAGVLTDAEFEAAKDRFGGT
jgi:hypothetical protein